MLEVRDLRKVFRRRRGGPAVEALGGVSFDLGRGETLGVVGESGSGKTTLGRVLVRLMKATSGSVVYEGIDLLHPSRVERRRLSREIQIIFQDPFSSMNPRMRIGRVIAEGVRVASKEMSLGPQRIVELLDLVRLPATVADVYPHELSGGMRQRVAIARALAVEPRLLIADEPVSALDVSMQSSVLNLLMGLQQDLGLSFLFIGHDLRVVRHMSDRIIVMHKGLIVEEGDPDQIFFQPRADYTRTLVQSVPGRLDQPSLS